MQSDEARARFASVPVARLATIGAQGRPHLVPITFALVGQACIVTAVDRKPKRTTALQRLANIAADPRVSALADHYEEDWNRLWWVRADGTAQVLMPDGDPDLRAAALTALAARYPSYADSPPDSALILVTVERWSGWSAARRPSSSG